MGVERLLNGIVETPMKPEAVRLEILMKTPPIAPKIGYLSRWTA
jgi:hypothetical protein